MPALPNIGDLRHNVVLQGISADELLLAIGYVVQLGDSCRVMVHGNCVPSMFNERKNNVPGYIGGNLGCSGVSCEVLVAVDICKWATSSKFFGEKQKGDLWRSETFRILRAAQRTNSGNGQGELDCKHETKQALQKFDPEGVQRAESSYKSVGLSFGQLRKRSLDAIPMFAVVLARLSYLRPMQ